METGSILQKPEIEHHFGVMRASNVTYMEGSCCIKIKLNCYNRKYEKKKLKQKSPNQTNKKKHVKINTKSC